MKHYLILSFFIFGLVTVKAQSFSFTDEIRFARYLEDKEQFQEAGFVLKSIDTFNLLNTQKDSLYYEIGWLAYTEKHLDSATLFLKRVSSSDARFTKSRFFSAYCLAFRKQYTESEIMINSMSFSDSILSELKTFQLAGLALLKKDAKTYDTLHKSFTYSSYLLNKEEKEMDVYAQKIFSYKRRSPFLAGLYSAVVPGLGKIYAGKKKQGLAAMLPVLSFGLLAAEAAYQNKGINNGRFWLMGSVFAIFYVGDIWGSVEAVKIKNQELDRLYENEVLFNMHIPLRNYFN